MALKRVNSRQHPTPAQLAARARFAAMAKNRARSRPQGGVSAHATSSLLRGRPIHEGVPTINTRQGRDMHVVLTTSTATQPNTGAAGAAVSGDSLVTRNYRNPAIAALWSSRQTAGFCQVAYPTGHDTTRGYRASVASSATDLTLPLGMQLPLTPQEVIAHQLSGSNTAGDVEQDSWLTAYEQDQGQNWLTWEQVRARMRELTTVEASIVSAAGPNYSGAALINAGSDLLIANRDYAILGATSRTRCHALGIVGPDTGNDRLAVPGWSVQAHIGSRFFAQVFGACPVLNSGNRNATNLFVHTDENAGTFIVCWYLALLA